MASKTPAETKEARIQRAGLSHSPHADGGRGFPFWERFPDKATVKVFVPFLPLNPTTLMFSTTSLTSFIHTCIQEKRKLGYNYPFISISSGNIEIFAVWWTFVLLRHSAWHHFPLCMGLIAELCYCPPTQQWNHSSPKKPSEWTRLNKRSRKGGGTTSYQRIFLFAAAVSDKVI